MTALPPPQATAAGRERHGPPPTILLVDDHEPSLRALARLLRRVGYTVQEARSVAAARGIMAEGPPDVLISDLELTDGDGCDLLREILSAFPHTCGIALSGYDGTACEDRCRQAGFRLLLSKPVTLETVIAAIESCPARDRVTAAAKSASGPQSTPSTRASTDFATYHS